MTLEDHELLREVERLTLDPARRSRILLEGILERNLRMLAATSHAMPQLRFAYSVKTNCDPRVLHRANEHRLYAEAIGPQELALALDAGFGQRTIYNGPVPAWSTGLCPGVVFSDSIEAFAGNARRLSGTLVGVRIRPDGIVSRFGVPRERFDDLATALAASGRREIGVSLHVRPQDYDGRTWRDIVASGLRFARDLEDASGARVTLFDAGGGKTPQEFDAALQAGDFEWAIGAARTALPHADAFVLEPGQAVVTPVGLVVAPVLEVRREGAHRAVVVDAGYPDLPQIGTFAHRVVALIDGEAMLLARGDDRVLGCTCLEYDVIREGIRLPAHAERLQAIVVADAGAYDWSMSFDFARGGNKGFDDGVEAHASQLHPSDTRDGNAARSGAG